MPQAAVESESVLPTLVLSSVKAVYDSVLEWLLGVLPGGALHRPTCKRLALLVTGLLADNKATAAGLASTLHRLRITPTRELSIQRRIDRLEADPRLDPALVLPMLFRQLLPTLLRSALAEHAANEGSGAAHHGRYLSVRVVLDGSTERDDVHILSIGLGYQGLVLPLAVRCHKQNVPLTQGEYMAQVTSLISEVQSILPGELRPHVLFLADRLFGTPGMIDLLTGVGWHWVLRVQGQTRVRGADGRERAIRDLVPEPGRVWVSESNLPLDVTTPIAAFKQAGWRACKVVAAWLVGQDEPWLLLTDLAASNDRFRDYARRWEIERLFLTWKSHGFDLEAVPLRAPQELGRLLTGLVIATLWRLAAAIPVAAQQLDDLARRVPLARQVPLFPDYPAPPRPTPPWPAKFSLFTWGGKQFRDISTYWGTPALVWTLPNWNAPTWSQQCCNAYYDAA